MIRLFANLDADLFGVDGLQATKRLKSFCFEIFSLSNFDSTQLSFTNLVSKLLIAMRLAVMRWSEMALTLMILRWRRSGRDYAI